MKRPPTPRQPPRASSLAVFAAPLALLLADLFLDDGVVALLEPARHGQQILGVQVYLLRIPFFAAIPRFKLCSMATFGIPFLAGGRRLARA